MGITGEAPEDMTMEQNADQRKLIIDRIVAQAKCHPADWQNECAELMANNNLTIDEIPTC